MPVEERTIYLLKLVNRYMDVIKEAKLILGEECLDYFDKNAPMDSNLRVKSRVVSNVDNTMLATAYPEVYEELFRQGKLVAKAQDLADFDDDVRANVISQRKTSWLEYNEKS